MRSKNQAHFSIARNVDRTFESGWRQNLAKITSARCLSHLFCSANFSSRGTRGIFLASKRVASSESTG